MAENPVRAQIRPIAGIRTPLFTALRKTTVSSIVICHVGSGRPDSFDLSVALGNEAEDPKQLLYHDTPVPSRFPFVATIGGTLVADDVVYFTALGGNLSATLFGVEYD